MTANKRMNLITSSTLSLLNLLALLILFWSCYRGLDLSDESYYYLGYLFYDHNPNLYPASFHMVYDTFFGWGNFTLTEIRVLRLLLTLLSSILLFVSAKSILGSNSVSEKLILFNLILSGMLLSYSWAPLTLSYNSMSSLLIAMIVGLWIFFIANQRVGIKVFFSLVLGGLFTILFFIKITNLLLLLLLIVLTRYLIHRKYIFYCYPSKFIWVYPLSFTLGIFAFLAIISEGTIQQAVVEHIKASFGILSNDSTHTASYLMNRYYNNAKMVLIKLKYPLAVLILLYFFIQLFWKKIKLENRLKGASFFKVLGVLILVLLIIQNDYWKGGTKVVYTMLIIYVYIAVFVFLNRLLEKKPMVLVVVLGLLSIPISGALGTNNGLSAQVLFYGVFIFLALYYIVSSSKNHFFKFVIFTVLVCLGTSQIVSATIIFPYRQSKLTESKNNLDDVPALSSLNVDSTQYKLRGELAFLDEIKANHIYAYSAQRGMVLLSNKKPYSLEWFNENATEKICEVVTKSKINAKDIIFLLPSQAPLQKEVIQCMKNNGIFFEKNYSLAKSFKYYDHYYEKETVLNVYVPNTNKNL